MCLDWDGSSPSQMMAVCLARVARCRSMQLYAALMTPSSNHLIETLSGPNVVFLILLGALYQCRRLAASAQNAFGSLIERAYMSLYLASSMKARCFHSAGTS